GSGWVSCAEIADYFDAVLQAGFKRRLQQIVEERLIAKVGVLILGQLRQRQGALGQCFENKCMTVLAYQGLDDWRNAVRPVAGKTRCTTYCQGFGGLHAVYLEAAGLLSL